MLTRMDFPRRILKVQFVSQTDADSFEGYEGFILQIIRLLISVGPQSLTFYARDADLFGCLRPPTDVVGRRQGWSESQPFRERSLDGAVIS
jgi:hypothetical protein